MALRAGHHCLVPWFSHWESFKCGNGAAITLLELELWTSRFPGHILDVSLVVLSILSCTYRAAFGDADELIQVGLSMGNRVMRGDRDVAGVRLATVQGPSDAWERRKRTRGGKAGGHVAAHYI